MFPENDLQFKIFSTKRTRTLDETMKIIMENNHEKKKAGERVDLSANSISNSHSYIGEDQAKIVDFKVTSCYRCLPKKNK